MSKLPDSPKTFEVALSKELFDYLEKMCLSKLGMVVSWMSYRTIFDSLQKMNGIIACGILDEVGEILECRVPDSFPKEQMSQLYAIEAGMLRNLEKYFGEFVYRLSQFGNSAQIIYRYKGIYIVASSTNSAETLLEQVRKAMR